MTLKSEMVPIGALLIDTDTKLTPSMCKAIAAATDDRGRPLGIRGVIRYLSFETPWAGDLDVAEVTAIAEANLGLIAVQHAHAPGWVPNSTKGVLDGGAALMNALKARLPHGATLCLDLEGVSTAAPQADTIKYCEQWWSAVTRNGYDAMLYIGYQCGLTAAQLYALPFQNYWRSLSEVPTPLPRGFSTWQIQGASGNGTPFPGVPGLLVDYNIVGRDYKGGGPYWTVAA